MTSEPQRTTSGMTSLRRLRVAAVLTVAGLAISLFWLIRRFFAHPPPGTGAQTQYVFFFLASAAVATLASGAAVGLAVPILVREPALRTPTRIAFSLAAALTALLVLTFWASMFLRFQARSVSCFSRWHRASPFFSWSARCSDFGQNRLDGGPSLP